ncbi:TetR/AcrR family transcriptional regulator [Geodermatophilus sabuli]|uniref:Transcriptional regulator, TetR family n=1 Tax=Geodermatophilus sabuli TaxID=1564158 RepID=A0A285EIT1_9ACTN|nr:TetR/AcrR family transcriptional regulator [Geodermatophilus sabuli]MBB3086863.1 AcrR family transcriptional regulator [Geodermatophilus sabuli]SNX98763.1 transcriptional regulator, TetR family [Geodermatophilus sabuli]
MSDLPSRRVRKKAQNRAHIRQIAQSLFAERGFETVTIADVAATAGVAVQTVFNHFSSKEELFFDGHTPWVAGPAEAVRSRPAGVAPLDALHEYLTTRVGLHAHRLATADGRAFVATLEASPALRAHERELHHESMAFLAEALQEAWDGDGGSPALTEDPCTVASVTASVWLAAVRTLIRDQRRGLSEATGHCPHGTERGAAAARATADRVFTGLVRAMPLAGAVPATPASALLSRTG